MNLTDTLNVLICEIETKKTDAAFEEAVLFLEKYWAMSTFDAEQTLLDALNED